MNALSEALRIAQRAKYASGGSLPSGMPNIANNVTGGLHSPVPGRTDHLPLSVPPGSYVLPADVVSGLGQGNTVAGMKILDGMFKTHSIAPLPPGSKGIDIAAAGGEYVIGPDVVAHLGEGNVKQGHAILDAFVRQVRAKTVKTLKSMPGPKK